jgi:hypothetical protein
VQELHRRGVPEGVQRDTLLLDGHAVAGGVSDVQCEASFERVAGEPSATDRGDSRVWLAERAGNPDDPLSTGGIEIGHVEQQRFAAATGRGAPQQQLDRVR